MLPSGRHERFFYLSVDFLRDPADPKEEIRLQALRDAYPQVADLALRGSETRTCCRRAPSRFVCTRWAAGAP
jgi:hypothetical protein